MKKVYEDMPGISSRNKLFNRLATAAVVLAAIGIGLFIYLGAQPTDVLTVNNSPFPTRVVQEGNDRVVILTLDYCKNIQVNGTLRISLVSQTREVFLPITQEKVPVGCTKADLPVIIPTGLVPDTYRVKFSAKYDINPLKKNVLEQFYSVPFAVK